MTFAEFDKKAPEGKHPLVGLVSWSADEQDDDSPLRHMHEVRGLRDTQKIIRDNSQLNQEGGRGGAGALFMADADTAGLTDIIGQDKLTKYHERRAAEASGKVSPEAHAKEVKDAEDKVRNLKAIADSNLVVSPQMFMLSEPYAHTFIPDETARQLNPDVLIGRGNENVRSYAPRDAVTNFLLSTYLEAARGSKDMKDVPKDWRAFAEYLMQPQLLPKLGFARGTFTAADGKHWKSEGTPLDIKTAASRTGFNAKKGLSRQPRAMTSSIPDIYAIATDKDIGKFLKVDDADPASLKQAGMFLENARKGLLDYAARLAPDAHNVLQLPRELAEQFISRGKTLKLTDAGEKLAALLSGARVGWNKDLSKSAAALLGIRDSDVCMKTILRPGAQYDDRLLDYFKKAWEEAYATPAHTADVFRSF